MRFKAPIPSLASRKNTRSFQALFGVMREGRKADAACIFAEASCLNKVRRNSMSGIGVIANVEVLKLRAVFRPAQALFAWRYLTSGLRSQSAKNQ